jgi:hypothetical protein
VLLCFWASGAALPLALTEHSDEFAVGVLERLGARVNRIAAVNMLGSY